MAPLFYDFLSVTTSSTSTPAPSPCKVKLTPEKIEHKSCISQEEVLLASCSGACQSSASFLLEAPYFQQECSCCRPTEFEDVEVPMFCLRKRSSSLTIKRIKTCDCSPCNAKLVLPTDPTEEQSGSGLEERFVEDEESGNTNISSGRQKRSVAGMLYDMFVGH